MPTINPALNQNAILSGKECDNIHSAKSLAEIEILLSEKSKYLNDFYRELLIESSKNLSVPKIEALQKALKVNAKDIASIIDLLETAKHSDLSCVLEDWKKAYSICRRHETRIANISLELELKRENTEKERESNVIDVTAALFAASVIPNALYSWIKAMPMADDKIAMICSCLAAGIGVSFALRKQIKKIWRCASKAVVNKSNTTEQGIFERPSMDCPKIIRFPQKPRNP